jgi:CheY-like chemotaxis protein/nitrogen-specific signal transduction histidine kinase
MEHLFNVLEKALEHRRLKSKVDELETANRLKSEFLANMSHELRTPLNAIVGYTSLVLEGAYGPPLPEQASALDRVLINSKNLLALINNILDISKLTAGMMPVFVEDFDAAALIREVAQTLQCLAAQKGLSLDIEAPLPILIRSDKTKVKQILINLTANAVKFTDKGAVTLRATGAPDGEVELNVRDTGPGIAPEHLGYIFERFTQVDGSATRAHGGTGLGLSITHKLCELLGGSVSVESRVGEGSVFTARLPAARRPADSKLLPIPAQIERHKGRKVLLCIDDDPEVLRLLRDSLAGTEYEFCGAASAGEGLALARQLHPFVITLDILMPRRDGWSVLQELKKDPQLRSIPVFILSIIENRALGFSLGVSDYIVKPFDRKDLLEKLRGQERLLGRRILVADDDPEMLELFRASLSQEGFQVQTAVSGAEVMSCLRQQRPDVLYLDLGLPDMSGFEVVERIYENPALAGLPIVILTAKDLSDAEKTQLEARVAAVIQKCAMSLPDILRDLKTRLTIMTAGTPR